MCRTRCAQKKILQRENIFYNQISVFLRQAFHNYINITGNIININWTWTHEGREYGEYMCSDVLCCGTENMHATPDNIYTDKKQGDNPRKILCDMLNGTIRQICTHKCEIIFFFCSRTLKNKQHIFNAYTFLSIMWVFARYI